MAPERYAPERWPGARLYSLPGHSKYHGFFLGVMEVKQGRDYLI